jgi:hypothetical protein
MMRVPDELRKCVAFVGFRMADGSERLAGTSFFLGRPIEGSDQFFGYFVTARHVIDGIRDRGLAEALIRLNTTTGRSVWGTTKISEWHAHPDPAVDVAVFRSGVPEGTDHLAYPTTSAGTTEVLQREEIDIGSEAVVLGLFAHHFGTDRNIPILRTGNIAAMREERVATRSGLMEAYLVEVRSIGGLSGSPVFARTPPMRVTADGKLLFNRKPDSAFLLLGLVHGHYDTSAAKVDISADDIANASERINVGIAIVVPVERILETLAQPAILMVENQIEDDIRRGLQPPELPSVESEPLAG